MLRQIIYSIARTQFQQSFAFLASILAVLILLLSTPVFAQSQTISNRGRLEIALKLIQEQRCDDALPILERLHRNELNTFIYFDRLIECEIELKKYGRALERVQKYKKNGSNKALTGVLEVKFSFSWGIRNSHSIYGMKILKRIQRCCSFILTQLGLWLTVKLLNKRCRCMRKHK